MKKNNFNILKALNEKIVGMGYSYSILNFFKSFFLYAFLICILGYFHKLQPMYIIFLIIAFFAMLPFSIFAQYKYLYEQKRFQELCTYMKQMRINYKTYKKILISLEETLTVFEPDDRIYPYIVDAIQAIKDGKDYRYALDIIETPFKNSYITKLHCFMILGETEGGDGVYKALDTIDFENWQSDTFIYQTQKHKQQKQNGKYTLLSLIASLIVILLFQYIFNETGDVLIRVFGLVSFQLETFLYFLFVIMSYISIASLITGKWIREDE